MVASQKVQGQLMRPAAEVASQRDGGDGWAGIGSVLSATITAVQRPRSAITAAPAAPVKQTDPVGESLRQVRAVHRGGQGEDDTVLRQVVAGLPPTYIRST